MNRLARLLLLTFIESFATVLIERGVYFYTDHFKNWDEAENLWLALGIGIAYILGALVSHKLCTLFSERSVLLFTLIAHAACHASLAFFQNPVPFLAVNFLLSGLAGLKWPIVESYISAGRNPASTAKAIGYFNISWSISVPLAIIVTGPLLTTFKANFFLLPILINASAVAILFTLEKKPVHLHADHPERLSPDRLARFRGLLNSSRWSLVGSYTLMFLLAPLAPKIFDSLGYPDPALATPLWSITDASRCFIFLALNYYTGWHGRRSLLAVSIAALPVGFLMVLFGHNLPTVLTGEVILGTSMSIIYFAALYYAMVTKNASVDAGGGHEAIIGSGFALGPAIGLLGLHLTPLTHNPTTGMLTAVTPAILACLLAGLLPLTRMPRHK